MNDTEAAATVAEALRAGAPLGSVAGVRIAVRTVLEKRDAATGRVFERITVEDDGTRTVETVDQE